MGLGGQFAVISWIIMMLVLYAHNWDILLMVGGGSGVQIITDIAMITFGLW